MREPEDVVEQVETTFKSVQNPDLDILFVVDDSGSMADKQAAFATGVQPLLDQLALRDGGRPNLHIGVVSSDMGTSGSANGPGPAIGAGADGACSPAGKGGVLQLGAATLQTGNFLIDDRDGTRNYDGSLADVLSAMLQLGSNGCGFEQPLAAMRAALDDNPMNEGFLRPEANLAVVVISDEDDCSLIHSTMVGDGPRLGPLTSFRCFANGVVCPQDGDSNPTSLGAKLDCQPRTETTYMEDPATFRTFLLGLKGNDARKLVFGLAAGDPFKPVVALQQADLVLQSACASGVIATPAVRLSSLVQSLPGGELDSMCTSNGFGYSGPAMKALDGSACVSVDDGLGDGEHSCTLTEVRASAPDAPTTIPECTGGATTDCFEIEDADSRCDLGKSRVVVHRTTPAADDAWSTLTCDVHYLLL